jgi:hypothetical protein
MPGQPQQHHQATERARFIGTRAGNGTIADTMRSLGELAALPHTPGWTRPRPPGPPLRVNDAAAWSRGVVAPAPVPAPRLASPPPGFIIGP